MNLDLAGWIKPTPQRRLPLINCLSFIVIGLMIVAYTFPSFIEHGYSDWREPAAIGLGIVAGGLGTAAAIVTAPAWVTGLGIGAGVCTIAAGGLALWDYLDGPDDEPSRPPTTADDYYKNYSYECSHCNQSWSFNTAEEYENFSHQAGIDCWPYGGP